ncbi:MAG: hypothetical protein ACRC0V_09380, partial [Fusobacteriaceae bacterium]
MGYDDLKKIIKLNRNVDKCMAYAKIHERIKERDKAIEDNEVIDINFKLLLEKAGKIQVNYEDEISKNEKLEKELKDLKHRYNLMQGKHEIEINKMSVDISEKSDLELEITEVTEELNKVKANHVEIEKQYEKFKEETN